MLNALTIDVEEWFCVYNLVNVIDKEDWYKYESRVVKSIEILINILQEYNVKATFFVLGWIAEKYPEIIYKIDKQGHEIATHGYSHSLLTDLSPDQFEEDLTKSIEVITQHTSQEIIGFRAPSFTITKSTYWALGILERHGIRYDSSVFPIGFHPDYGIQDSPLAPYKISDNLLEFPLGCFEILGRRLPCGGGGYFRIFPYSYTKFGIRQCNKNGRPVVFYLHPWEIDPGQPRVKLPVLKRIRQYYNLNKTEKRLKKLLKDFEFTTIREILNL